MQGVLFPALEEQLGPLSDKHRQLVAVLGMIRIEALVGAWSGGVGRPAKHRRAMACSFVAKAGVPSDRSSLLGWKAVYNMSDTRQLGAEQAAERGQYLPGMRTSGPEGHVDSISFMPGTNPGPTAQ